MTYRLRPNAERIESKHFQDGFCIAFFLGLWVILLISLIQEFDWSTLFAAVIMPAVIAVFVREQMIEEEMLANGTGVYEFTFSKMTDLHSGEVLEYSSIRDAYFHEGNLYLPGAREIILTERVYGKEALQRVAHLIGAN